MNDIIKGILHSRRAFLSMLSAVGLAAAAPSALLDAAKVANNAIDHDLAERMPEGYQAYSANPNFAEIWGDVDRTPPVKTDTGIAWFQKTGDDSWHLFSFNPETDFERADAAELYNVYFYKSWRTLPELHSLVRGLGPWVLRLVYQGIPCGLLTKEITPRLLKMKQIDRAWWDADQTGLTNNLEDAACLSAEHVLQLAPMLNTTIDPSDEPDEDMYYEPVIPSNAFKDLRVLQLRKSGWGPQVGQKYDLKELERIYKPAAPFALTDKHPFIRASDAWLALISYGSGPGSSTIPSAQWLCWKCACSRNDETGECPDCDCAPVEMRGNKAIVLAHMFVRKGTRGRYTYFGLGHLPPNDYDAEIGFDVSPRIDADLYRMLGGDLRWQAMFEDADGAIHDLPTLDTANAVANCLAAMSGHSTGALHVRRWGPELIYVRFSGDRCFARYFGSTLDCNPLEFLTNPDFVGDPHARTTLQGDPHEQTICANNILPVTIIAPLLKSLASPDGTRPWPDRWLAARCRTRLLHHAANRGDRTKLSV